MKLVVVTRSLSKVIVCVLVSSCLAAPASQSLSIKDDGSYDFAYETGKEGGSHSRQESRGPDGAVVGKFSYEAPTGNLRVVNYRADDLGFVANGDVGVDGAPPGQFPFVPEGQEESVDKYSEDLKQDEGEKDEQESSPSNEQQDEDDDEKEEKPEEPKEDDPPEGFPPGFFLHNFHGLRRLEEPVKDDDENQQITSRSDEPSSDPKFFTHIIHYQSAPGAHLLPWHQTQFAPLSWPAALQHHPVYVHSYQQPNAYGYSYQY